jgi:Na+-transporting methylmalonyl-CoA/oxaloacetate decarboxylase gamma subunit
VYAQTVLQALAILAVGMALVFLALGLIVLVMMAMGRWLGGEAEPDGSSLAHHELDDDRARVAALAVAIVLAQTEAQTGNTSAWRLTSDPGEAGSWQALHRTRALARELGRARGRGE